mgnify:FL=1
MNKPKQLTFPWNKPNKSTYNNFYFDKKNLALKNSLKGNDDLFLYGINQCGKSYLLQATCNFYSLQNKSSVYMPFKDLINKGVSLIESLEYLDVICIDDIDLIASVKEWEIGIFNLINDCMTSNCRLIFSSSLNPSKINFELKDLSSRIKKIDHIELFPISDNELTEALKFMCKSRSINLTNREINYLITYSKRSISYLLSIIDSLDKHSMESKRKITIPLIKEIIEC